MDQMRQDYEDVFGSVLGVFGTSLLGLKYQDIPSWDSVGHMALMAALEERFDILLDMDDILDFSSFEKGIEILAKYDVKV